MTPEQIKALAKQAGGTTHTTMGDRLMIFLPVALAEFTRMVRESALDEAAEKCDDLHEMLFCHRDKAGAEVVRSLQDDIRSLK